VDDEEFVYKESENSQNYVLSQSG